MRKFLRRIADPWIALAVSLLAVSERKTQRGYTTVVNILIAVLVVLAIIVLLWIIFQHIATK